MRNTQLIQLLKTLSVYEMNRFEKYLRSSFFNSSNNVTGLFMLLKKYHPEFEEKHVAKEKVFSKLFGHTKYNDKKMRYLTYDLLRLAEDFLGQLNYSKDRFSLRVNSLKELIERKQIKLAEKKIDDAQKDLQPQNYPNEVYFYYKHLLKSQSNFLRLITDKILDPGDLIEEGENIVLLMFVVLMQTSFNLTVGKNSFNSDVPFNIIYDFLNDLDLESLLGKAKKYNYKNTETLELYYSMIRLTESTQNEEDFYKLKSSIGRYAELLNHQDLYNLFTALHSFCIRKVIRGDTNFQKEQFELDRMALEYDAYSPIKHKHIQVINFRNFISSAVHIGEFRVAENIMKAYGDKIDPAQRTDTLNLCSAFIAYGKKDFESALRYLSKVRQNNVFFKFDIRTYQLRIYYESGHFESALELIDSYKHFLNKSKEVAKVRKEAVMNFVDFTGELIKLKLNTSRSEPNQLRDKISEIDYITSKDWLLEKLNEFK